MAAKYDRIGASYAKLRRADPRIAAQIHSALGTAECVVNIGAGTGSYEPADRSVVAVEPSAEMIAKRPGGAGLAIQASAEELPFEDNSFDAAMVILTIHHWSDQPGGLAEMRRVSRGPVVLLTFDPTARPWLTDYLPQLAELDEQVMPRMEDYGRWLGDFRVETVPVPKGCTDGFLYAYWDRPEAYFDAHLRSGCSSFWAIEGVDEGLNWLREDIDRGDWAQRYAYLAGLGSYDAGYRLVIAS